jgi:hypothetical protein
VWVVVLHSKPKKFQFYRIEGPRVTRVSS